jgi:hypothetical protein
MSNKLLSDVIMQLLTGHFLNSLPGVEEKSFQYFEPKKGVQSKIIGVELLQR